MLDKPPPGCRPGCVHTHEAHTRSVKVAIMRDLGELSGWLSPGGRPWIIQAQDHVQESVTHAGRHTHPSRVPKWPSRRRAELPLAGPVDGLEARAAAEKLLRGGGHLSRGLGRGCRARPASRLPMLTAGHSRRVWQNFASRPASCAALVLTCARPAICPL